MVAAKKNFIYIFPLNSIFTEAIIYHYYKKSKYTLEERSDNILIRNVALTKIVH